VATIDHVTVRASDVERSLRMFTQSFDLLAFDGERYDGDGFHAWADFSIAAARDERPPTNGLHVGFIATSRAQVDGWWRALTAAGYEDDGAPGPRPQYSPSYYGAFIRDADGNSVEAVHHDTVDRASGMIDHLWIRVADVAATRRFYAAVAEATGAGFLDPGDRVHVKTGHGSFTLLNGPPTVNAHLAFGVDDEQLVRAFHAAALAAGGRDNGAPGERPAYHPGYFGAYALDPDGNNIEAVWHGR
jgi:catechol 2,3-dioxygenase-like lactoylglutathione lyase family enzyme